MQWVGEAGVGDVRRPPSMQTRITILTQAVSDASVTSDKAKGRMLLSVAHAARTKAAASEAASDGITTPGICPEQILRLARHRVQCKPHLVDLLMSLTPI